MCEIEHVVVALTRWGELENYASFVLPEADALMSVSTFDQEQCLVGAFGGVRMPRMKLRTLGHVVRAAGDEGRGLLTPGMTPRMKDGVRERGVREGDVREGDAVRDGDAPPREGDARDTGWDTPARA